MLSNIDLDGKSYEQIREEAIARIPLYSREWTNYNVSDPGITILENFAAFMALQQSELNEVPEKARRRLLELAGFTARKGNCAQAYILPEQENTKQDSFLPDRMKLYAQDICFELEQNVPVREMRILSVKSSAVRRDLSQSRQINNLLDKHGFKGGLPLFGESPSGGETVHLYLSDVPGAGQKAAVFFALAHPFPRNPCEKGIPNPFANIRWEILTQKGFAEIAVEDDTFCLLQDGYVVFALDRRTHDSLVRCSDEKAYVIRLTLVRANYDLVPRVQRIIGLSVPAVQRDTQSDVMLLSPAAVCPFCFDIRSCLLRNGYLEIYGKEADHGYHRYHDASAYREAGHRYQYGEAGHRYYTAEYRADDTVILRFDEKKPPQELLVVCRGKEVMAYRKLGTLYGYDNQSVQLPASGKIFPEDFSVLVVEKKGAEDRVCHVVKPETRTAGEVFYSVSEADNTLTVHDCGYYEGAELRLGSCAFYKGDGGNIRAGTRLVCEQDGRKQSFANCTDVTNGRFEESLEQVRSRFAADVTAPAAMVTQRDCEQLVKRIPGLSIHKIGVCPMTSKNEIHITVKPNSPEAFPRLSDTYRHEMSRYLEKYRMLTTKIIIKQPVYVPIHVTGTISVKKQFIHDKEMIEETLRKMLDGICSEAGFGSKIVFHELYDCLRNIDCVEEIYDLSIFPDNSQWADKTGLDIRLKPNALYYPGRIRIERIR